MKNYHFKYTATPSQEHADFYIDIRNQHVDIEAENLKEACVAFAEAVDDKWCLSLTKNGLRTARPMYRDRENAEPLQVGLVFNAHTEIEFNNYQFKHRNILLWCEIHEAVNPGFEEVA